MTSPDLIPADFQKLQINFTQHLRDPEKKPIPKGIENRRMLIYRDLLFNNLNGFLTGNFPVLYELYRKEAWLRLVRAFFVQYRCQSPYFVEIPKEFIHFLESVYQPTEEDPAFLLELAHYEWMEVVLMTAKQEPDWQQIDRYGDLLEGIPVFSPLAYCLNYQWPVHQIRADFQPETPLDQPISIIIYRDVEDSVKFIETNPVTARLIQLMQAETGQNGSALMRQIAEELQHPEPDIVLQGGHQILLKLHHAQIVLGIKL